jgi:hypothetical protein
MNIRNCVREHNEDTFFSWNIYAWFIDVIKI